MRRTSTWNYRQWGYIGFNGGGSDTSRVPHGEPYAGKLHVRFDEGAGVPHGASRSTLHPCTLCYVSPCDRGGEIDLATAKAVLAELDGWSLSVQLHKLLGFR